MGLANKFAALAKLHDLITCESKVQVVVAPGRHGVLFALGRHEVLTDDT